MPWSAFQFCRPRRRQQCRCRFQWRWRSPHIAHHISAYVYECMIVCACVHVCMSACMHVWTAVCKYFRSSTSYMPTPHECQRFVFCLLLVTLSLPPQRWWRRSHTQLSIKSMGGCFLFVFNFLFLRFSRARLMCLVCTHTHPHIYIYIYRNIYICAYVCEICVLWILRNLLLLLNFSTLWNFAVAFRQISVPWHCFQPCLA